MTNIDIYPDSTNELENDYPNQPDENENNRKFPDDDSNVGDNPIYHNKDDEVPTNENIPSEIENDNVTGTNDTIPSEIENDDVPSLTSENEVNQDVGSGKGGVYPYNINSNTADEDDEDENGIEPKQGPIDTNEHQDFDNSDQDSENSHQI